MFGVSKRSRGTSTVLPRAGRTDTITHMSSSMGFVLFGQYSIAFGGAEEVVL